MEKIIGIKFNSATKVLEDVFFLGDEVPFMALTIGMPVKVNNDKILSNGTKGKISGFCTNLRGTVLVQIDWLEGAPPICIKPESVESSLPKHFWMVAPVLNETSGRTAYAGDQGLAYRRAGVNAPTMRYYTREDAEAAALELRTRYPNNEYLILETVAVSNGTEFFAL